MDPGVWVCALAVLGACNFVYGLDETRLREGSPRTLYFDNSASTTDLVDFPVMVVPDATFDLGDVTDPTTQIRFVDDRGASLPFEIERWDPGGETVLWVRVPRIRAGRTDDRIEMQFGAEVTGTEDAATVWSSYDLVAHRAAVDGTIPESTGRSVGRGTGIAPRDGVIGDAIGLPADATFENSGALFDGWPTFTLELWVYADYGSSNLGGSEPVFLDRRRAITNGRLFEGMGIPGILTLQIDCVFALGGGVTINTYLQLKRWSHVVYTYDGSALYLYLNGGFADIRAIASSLVAGPSPLSIGHATRSMTGMIDELRVSRGYRTPDWVNAQHLSMSRRFVTFSSSR